MLAVLASKFATPLSELENRPMWQIMELAELAEKMAKDT